MKIAVLGMGNIGGTLGKRWAATGHEVVFGVRDPDSPKVQAFLEMVKGQARADTLDEAIALGEVVVFAIPAGTVEETVAAYGVALHDKIVIDATNKFGAPMVNSIDVLAARAPRAHIYRAFNSLGWENLVEPYFGQTQADLFYCGPNGETRLIVEGLITDVGFRPVRLGGLDKARLVDAVGEIWVTLAFEQKMGRRLAFKVLTE